MSASTAKSDSKQKLIEAALYVYRARGYAGTRVEDICEQADVTKGSFFHHFKSKEELTLAAVKFFSDMAEQLFSQAPYTKQNDPLERLLGYIDFRAKILTGELAEYTCLLGTLTQETYATHPTIRQACLQGFDAHIGQLVTDIDAAKKEYGCSAALSSESLGYFIQSVLQGSFIFAKAQQDPRVVKDSLAHLKKYLLQIFSGEKKTQTRRSK